MEKGGCSFLQENRKPEEVCLFEISVLDDHGYLKTIFKIESIAIHVRLQLFVIEINITNHSKNI